MKNSDNMEIIFATNNTHKLFEVRNLFAVIPEIQIISLAEAGITTEIPETAETLEENASEKAWFIYKICGKNCVADDTGLEIEALGNRPGVYSARYAGEGCTFADNVKKVLLEMKEITNRKARFRTIVSLIINGNETRFEGIVNGEMLSNPKGNEGFGYDPIFIPEGYQISFAEMEIAEKNRISHRAKAFQKMIEFLNEKMK